MDRRSAAGWAVATGLVVAAIAVAVTSAFGLLDPADRPSLGRARPVDLTSTSTPDPPVETRTIVVEDTFPAGPGPTTPDATAPDPVPSTSTPSTPPSTRDDHDDDHGDDDGGRGRGRGRGRGGDDD